MCIHSVFPGKEPRLNDVTYPGTQAVQEWGPSPHPSESPGLLLPVRLRLPLPAFVLDVPIPNWFRESHTTVLRPRPHLSVGLRRPLPPHLSHTAVGSLSCGPYGEMRRDGEESPQLPNGYGRVRCEQCNTCVDMTFIYHFGNG